MSVQAKFGCQNDNGGGSSGSDSNHQHPLVCVKSFPVEIRRQGSALNLSQNTEQGQGQGDWGKEIILLWLPGSLVFTRDPVPVQVDT